MHTPHTTLNTGITCLFILIYICIYSFAITLSIDNTCVYLSLALSPSLSLYIYIYIWLYIYIYIYIHTNTPQIPSSLFLLLFFPSHCAGSTHCLARGLIRAGAHTTGSSWRGPLEISSGKVRVQRGSRSRVLLITHVHTHHAVFVFVV